jgi:uncharacterized protein
MKTKVLVIHGGNMFASHEEYVADLREKEVDIERLRPKTDWKDTLQTRLGSEYEVFLPTMPMPHNAEYALWKLWFEKILVKIDDISVFIGHSLGAMFLLKYYSEQKESKRVRALLLVAPVFSSSTKNGNETLSFTLGDNLDLLSENAKVIQFFHSTDDPVVPYENMLDFKSVLPNADYFSFDERGHFNTETFPELIQAVKKLV